MFHQPTRRGDYDLRMKWPTSTPAGYARCGACGALVIVVVKDGVPVGFEKHKIPSSARACPNGTEPRLKSKKRNRRSHKGKSVRTISGGLPGLGKGS